MSDNREESDERQQESETEELGRMNKDPEASRGEAYGMAGRRIAHFTLIEELGQGGQGSVYLARDEVLHRQVALKILHNMRALDPNSRLRFVREAEAASKLSHPGICAVYEFGEHEGIPFISMQHVEGVPLSDKISCMRQAGLENQESFVGYSAATSGSVLDGKQMSAEDERGAGHAPTMHARLSPDRTSIFDMVRIIESVARALHAAHEQSLIHRDIKPSNIMLDASEQPIILDFGMARDEASDATTLTQAGDLMGTPAYMSPEQVTRSSIPVDRRSDVYSLGVTLYECLTLERPFSSPTRHGLNQAIMFDEPRNPKTLNPDIPNELRIILGMAMEKSPDRRYQTAKAFADDLERFRERRPILAKPAGPWLKTMRWAQRNPVVVAPLVVGLMFLIATAAWTSLKNRELRQLAVEVGQKNSALQVQTQETAKNLDEAQRLADLKNLADAEKAMSMLWPLGSELPSRIASFRDRHAAMLSRLPEHETTLERIRGEALEYSEADRRADHREARLRIEALEDLSSQLRSQLTTSTIGEKARKRIELQLKRNAEERSALQASLHERKTWRYDGELAEYKNWMRESLTVLVDGLRSFKEPEVGALAELKERERRSRELVRATITGRDAEWKKCYARILTNGGYSGLELLPQEGLIPLGPDPTTGLEEFLHWASHAEGSAIPSRSASGLLEIDGKTGIILVLIPATRFRMGAVRPPDEDQTGPNLDPYAASREAPVHQLEMPAFFISKYEMTLGQWLRATGAAPSFYGVGYPVGNYTVTLSHPVTQVSWFDCSKTMNVLALELPTEAQWECAARAQTESIWSFGDDFAQIDEYENIADVSSRKRGAPAGWPFELHVHDEFSIHSPVGSFRANGFGLHDVGGNVSEWCRDRLGDYTNPVSPSDGLRVHDARMEFRISRGGNFSLGARHARCARRNTIGPDYRSDSLGLRPARAISF